MKKIVLIAVTMAMVVLPTVAQDTLEMFNPKLNYFVNSWPDSSWCYDPNPIESNGRCDMWAINFYTPDTLTVYGIATVLFMFPEDDSSRTEDRDPSHAVEDMLLFEHDSLLQLRQVAEPLPVCIATSTPSYYWKLEHGSGYVGYYPLSSIPEEVPVYERYFSQPYKIVDTFYVGMTTRFWECKNPFNENGQRVYSFGTYPQYNWVICTCMRPAPYLYYHRYRSDGHWEGDSTYHIFIMPIIDIDTAYWPGVGDTTGHADDTTGHTEAIDEVSANGYVLVSPNPATGEVKVTSTVGMMQVEVYNADGVKVMEKATASSEVQTRLDVSRLHSGSYIVRVHTPMGMAIKKLVMQ